MSHPSYPADGRSSGRSRADDGWGSTTVRGGSQPEPAARARPARDPWGGTRPTDAERQRDAEGWSPAGPGSRSAQRATRAADRRAEQSVRDLDERRAAALRQPERGVRWWIALLVLIVIAVIGGLIDTLDSVGISGGFNIGIVVASVVAILIVKRSHMFPIVIAPPIVYSLAAASQLYLRSDGLDKKRVVIDAAANYLVYGFPAIATATAAVLIIAGIRMITRR